MKISKAALLAATALLCIACASAPEAPAAVVSEPSVSSTPAPTPASDPEIESASADSDESPADPAIDSEFEPEQAEDPAFDPSEYGTVELDPEQAAMANADYALATLESLDAYEGASAECAAALGEAYARALEGKWKSAFDGLAAFDPDGADPYALAMSIDLVLGGALRTDMHVSFVLKDLEAGEQIETLRESEGEYEFFDFAPAPIAEARVNAGAAIPAVLHKLLGDYFYEALIYFSGTWSLPDEEIKGKCLENYAAAYAAGRRDEDAIGRQIELLVDGGRDAETESLLRAMIELKPEDPSLGLNLAQLLYELGRSEDCLVALEEAVAAYGDSSDRYQAMATAARITAQMDELEEYERYMGLIGEAMPDDPTPDLLRHLFSVENGWDEKADEVADRLVTKYASDPQVIHSLVSSWYSSDRQVAAKAFLDRSIAASQDKAGTATLRFYLAVLLAEDAVSDEERSAALAELDGAEAVFKEIEDPESEVFAVIAQLRESIGAASAEEPASP